jgi:hypothetical protein
MSCSAEIVDILTYDHNSLDSSLNYVALFITFLPVIHIHRQMDLNEKYLIYKYFWILLSLFLFGFQVRTS